ncbi:hypothetical protein E2562_022365 [Oryza meyeriana var. granulata]|uniref:Uncharacterized protein n=1 Tax=Oryza meyeriana var. granulata TaxID=110450 RepID=A0A6G1DP49_9ORYZ|nr:hypothetical protein E2562_022365 [Oryza meyeriana var. granulata]
MFKGRSGEVAVVGEASTFVGDGNAAAAVLAVAGKVANPRLSVPGLEPATSEPRSNKGDTSIHMHYGLASKPEENSVEDAADASPEGFVAKELMAFGCRNREDIPFVL